MNLNDCIELMRLLQTYKSKTRPGTGEFTRIVANMTKIDALGKVLAANAHVAWKW